jgi:hypothetical protein
VKAARFEFVPGVIDIVRHDQLGAAGLGVKEKSHHAGISTGLKRGG